MKRQIEKLSETMRYIKPRFIVFALVVLIITAGIATVVGREIHRLTSETLLLRGELNAQEAAIEYNRYLLTRVDIVTLVGSTVEDLLESGTDSAALEKYLTDETNNIIATLDPTTTGLYGWLNESYVDGSGWVPEADYVPTERPWYIETMDSDQAITFVDPYLDMQTKTVMMTVSKRFDDGKSVLAMDVSLAPIQEMVEEVSASTEGGQAFLLSADGIVIAHSDRSQLGISYLDAPDSLGGIIARKLLAEGRHQFEVDTAEGNYTVYINDLEGGWYSVSLINADVWHRPLHRAMFAFVAVLVFVVLSIAALFLHLTAKNAAMQELHTLVDREEKRGDELQALSETDRMTGLTDRVSGERKVDELLQSGGSGMFLELDIDDFKAINDSYGHQTGDLVILAVADALRSTFRSNDVTMRLGGDEFGAFAVGIVSREMGEAIVRRLFDRLSALNIPELNGQRISLSAGAVLDPERKHQSFHELYALADDAMYASKKTAGNVLTFHGD